MIIALHVIIALSSILLGLVALVRPSRALLNLSYSFITLTLMSGVLVALTATVRVPQLCLTAFVYCGGMATASLLARRKLAHVPVRSDD